MYMYYLHVHVCTIVHVVPCNVMTKTVVQYMYKKIIISLSLSLSLSLSFISFFSDVFGESAESGNIIILHFYTNYY